MVAGDLPAAPFASTPIISIAAPFAAPAPAPLSMPTPASRVARLAPFIASITTPIALVSLYLIGVAVLLFRVGLGMLVSGRLKRSAQPIDDERALDRLRVHLATCGLTHAPRLAETPRLFVPITMLVFQPVILLPCTWREWDAATLDAVLVHELSHVARRDALTQRLSLLYRAVFWCNPLSWWLHRRLTDLAEHASDEAALASGADQTEYAETLLGFFSLIDKGSRRADWHVAMARGAGAERRVDRIFAWTAGTSIKLRTSIVIAMIMVAAPIAMFAAAVRPSVIPVGAVARTAQLTLPSSPIVTAPARMTAATIHAQVSMPEPA
jgi:beta-lactamase regulating signal transducer with metallopeptidase domain